MPYLSQNNYGRDDIAERLKSFRPRVNPGVLPGNFWQPLTVRERMYRPSLYGLGDFGNPTGLSASQMGRALSAFPQGRRFGGDVGGNAPGAFGGGGAGQPGPPGRPGPAGPPGIPGDVVVLDSQQICVESLPFFDGTDDPLPCDAESPYDIVRSGTINFIDDPGQDLMELMANPRIEGGQFKYDKISGFGFRVSVVSSTVIDGGGNPVRRLHNLEFEPFLQVEVDATLPSVSC